MENCCSQKWIFQKRVEVAVQSVMIVLSVLAVLVLAFAPEEPAGMSAPKTSQAHNGAIVDHCAESLESAAKNKN